MKQIALLMVLAGSFSFLAGGLCAANSIEAKESKSTANFLAGLCLAGGLSFLVGFILICYCVYFD